MTANYLLISIGLGLAIAVVISVAYSYYLKAKIGGVKRERESVLKEAERYAEAVKKEAAVEVKDVLFQAKADADKEFKEGRNNLNQMEKRILTKEESLDKKFDQIEKKEASLAGREGNVVGRERVLAEKEAKLEALTEEQNKILENLSGLSVEEAKAEIFRRVEEQSRFESAKLAKRVEEEARETADKKAREIMGNSIQRYASDFVADATVSSVALPNDEIKGRIIGREGRNIRALEAATGVDLIVDDTPEVVTLSAFDPVRREIARLSLERLISDGRIHPARIEEVVEKARTEVDAIILEEGEKAVFELGLAGIHPDIIKTLGRLKYRTSYGQNVLQHSKEVAFIAGMLASELGADVKLAKRGGLLHDIGKAIDHEVEGTHHAIGSALAKKCGEKDMVVNCIAAHHGDVETECVEAALVAAADALSAARPGVRRESIENYIQRLETLEKMAKSYDGVEKCYAIQAGREVRLIVKPESVSDELSWTIARELAAKIEQEMTYPGQIKVTVVRESRFVEYAK